MHNQLNDMLGGTLWQKLLHSRSKISLAVYNSRYKWPTNDWQIPSITSLRQEIERYYANNYE